MASVVDTTVKYFSNLMSGAPALSGTVGSLLGVIRACLKDGFDLKTLSSLTVAGGVATAAFTGSHSAQIDSVVLIAGVTGGPTGWAGMNGEQKVTGRPGAASVTFATNLPDGTYTGTITMKMAPLGFAEIFSGTNVAAFQSTDPASTKMILRLDDTGATSARVVGCESMSDINTYAGLFPTALQMSGGGYWTKSNTANATAVQWMLIGDARAFYIHVCPGYASSSSFTQGFTKFFGDAVAFRPGGDAYACVLGYSITNNSSSQSDGQPEYNNATQHAFPRAPAGLGSALLNMCLPYTGVSSSTSGIDGLFGSFPSPIDGALRLSKRYFAVNTSSPPRGDAPGLYSTPHTLAFDSFKFNDRVPGSGPLAGRNLIVVNTTNTNTTSVPTASNTGATFFDITGPWR
ncbi:hypothetical protein [Variovorax atrisoli]|uniref:hypothetical protein n=1 Tax=Variovorax atrisoli TaxID=3394203 RepID=UPI001199DB40|nr:MULTISPECIES: hypothetical protein [Variovorax]MBB3641174.1 hypothetical protein [Variovorax sp. BK613]MDR6522781.1 hypothetical protein [Variovorax paradoxus]